MTINQAKFSKEDLELLFGASSLINVPKDFQVVGISTDTRTIEEKNCFVALKGENFDGHTKLVEAFNQAASIAIVEEKWYKENRNLINSYPLIIVNSTLIALQSLARFHRQRFDIPIVAIAGSNGKTTTKELTAHLLAQRFNVLKTYKNLNNQIGVPIMLLQLNSDHQAAVIEIGTNEPGEIAILSSILEPTHGLITNIGKEHLEKLESIDGVELEESFLFGYLLKHNGTAFINIDDTRIKKYLLILENKITFGTSENPDVYANIKLDEFLHPEIEFKISEQKINVKMQTNGITTGLNAIAATSIAFTLGLTINEIQNGLQSYLPEESHGYARMKIEKTKNFTIINDCYNANPNSMAYALSTLQSYNTKGKKIAILGDMRELGEHSNSEHIELLKLSKEAADSVLLIGDEMKKANEFLEYNFKHFIDKNDLYKYLESMISDDDVILVKASRGLKLEDIIIQLHK